MIHSISNYKFVINYPATYQNLPCDDQMVGEIVFDGKQFKTANGSLQFNLLRKANANGQARLSVDYKNSNSIPKKHLRMVVLLESPHVDEFAVTGQSYSTAPAWGRTGDRFDSYFLKVLNNPNNFSNIVSKLVGMPQGNVIFDIYFINAIQFQCSLGLNLKIANTLRDNIFFGLWNSNPNSFKQDLIDRLDFIDPYIIINACTINLQRLCVNASSLCPYLKNKNVIFLSSNEHRSCWCKGTFII